MGISSANFGLIVTVGELLGGWRHRRVLELGNQILREGVLTGEGRRTSKDYFASLGAEHISFDINGLDGAVPMDLCRPVPKEYWGSFDVVTNFGTSEHIENQEQVFRTIHDCCRVGGYMIHSVPLYGYWNGHSPYHYKLGFGKNLAIGQRYVLAHEEVVNRFRSKLLNIILHKSGDVPFDAKRLPVSHISWAKEYKTDSNNLF